ncbi:MAG TPA: shikimate dehydrogenase [Chitinophagaceae bacterium]|nr:shikimate dehydrogenase [Chitinophagaceae bacterium]
MKRYGLIGYPLSHSFSKKYFEEKFHREGITDCAYELFPIASIEELPGLLTRCPDLHGLNVTIPYKQAVLPFLHSTENLPSNLSACNCIAIENGRLTGYNTDVIGFEKSFAPLLQPHHRRALVLGTGGAALAVSYVLEKLDIDHTFVSRKRQALPVCVQYDEVDESILASYQVIINTTPLGMYPNEDQSPPLPYHALTPQHYLFDLIYNPAKTLFLRKGEERGAVIKNGEEMLVIQAEESWNIWKSSI